MSDSTVIGGVRASAAALPSARQACEVVFHARISSVVYGTDADLGPGHLVTEGGDRLVTEGSDMLTKES